MSGGMLLLVCRRVHLRHCVAFGWSGRNTADWIDRWRREAWNVWYWYRLRV